jgi:signal transduction histidine kinase
VDDILMAHSRIRLYSLLANMVLLVGAITLLFRTAVYRSVLHLVEVMGRFKRGDSSARAKENLTGEFRELARSFNGMLEEIQRSKENLQQQIEEATEVLAQQNRELYELNLQLYEAQRLLGQAERLALVGQLAATLAHEIGSPLSAVSTHLQMLLEDPQLDSRVINRLRLANEQIDRVCGIVENLLSAARQAPRRVPVDLEATVSKVAQLLGPTLEARRIRFQMQGEGGPFLMEGDPDQLQQLFLNLFNNSLDAIFDSGTLSIQVRRRPPNESLLQPHFQVEVSDSGVGIPAEEIEHIFDPFFTTKELGKGSGLGLAVCEEIVTRHGGRISVVSQPGRGTRFTILLPEIASNGASSLVQMARKERE